jgi:hypothetical protein
VEEIEETPKVVYNDDSIRSLDWKEHIRLRPGMYIGKLGDGSSVDELCLAGIEEPLADMDVSLYPNPASDYLTLVAHEALFNELIIMDLQGRIIVSQKTQDTKVDLDLTGLNPGNYLVNILLSNGKSGTKSVIVR